MNEEEFAQFLLLGHETHGVEFKSPGPLSNRRLAAQVVRAALGMANRRDGGWLIIGVDDNRGVINPVGLSERDLATWQYDLIADQMARYADPRVAFDRKIVEYNGNRYILIRVEEFSDIPVLCKRAYDDVLRERACYVRSRRKPETSEIPTFSDMRELLDLATEKRLKEHLAQLQRLGLIVLPAVVPTSTDQFERQRSDLNE